MTNVDSAQREETRQGKASPYVIQIRPYGCPIILTFHSIPGPLCTKRWYVLPPNFVKSRSRGIICYSDRVALKWDCCRYACQISERLDKSKRESHGFAYWIEAPVNDRQPCRQPCVATWLLNIYYLWHGIWQLLYSNKSHILYVHCADA